MRKLFQLSPCLSILFLAQKVCFFTEDQNDCDGWESSSTSKPVSIKALSHHFSSGFALFFILGNIKGLFFFVSNKRMK